MVDQIVDRVCKKLEDSLGKRMNSLEQAVNNLGALLNAPKNGGTVVNQDARLP